MSLLALIVFVVVLGILMYVVNTLVPMDGQIKRILNIAVVVFLLIWLCQAFGRLAPLEGVRIGR